MLTMMSPTTCCQGVIVVASHASGVVVRNHLSDISNLNHQENIQ